MIENKIEEYLLTEEADEKMLVTKLKKSLKDIDNLSKDNIERGFRNLYNRKIIGNEEIKDFTDSYKRYQEALWEMMELLANKETYY